MESAPTKFNKKVGHIIYVFLHGDVSNIFLHKRRIFAMKKIKMAIGPSFVFGY